MTMKRLIFALLLMLTVIPLQVWAVTDAASLLQRGREAASVTAQTCKGITVNINKSAKISRFMVIKIIS